MARRRAGFGEGQNDGQLSIRTAEFLLQARLVRFCEWAHLRKVHLLPKGKAGVICDGKECE
jgi:hypothetical protein